MFLISKNIKNITWQPMGFKQGWTLIIKKFLPTTQAHSHHMVTKYKQNIIKHQYTYKKFNFIDAGEEPYQNWRGLKPYSPPLVTPLWMVDLYALLTIIFGKMFSVKITLFNLSAWDNKVLILTIWSRNIVIAFLYPHVFFFAMVYGNHWLSLPKVWVCSL